MSFLGSFKVVEMNRWAVCGGHTPSYSSCEEAIELIVAATGQSDARALQDGAKRCTTGPFSAKTTMEAFFGGLLKSIDETLHVMNEPHRFLEQRGLSDDRAAFTALLDAMDAVCVHNVEASPRYRLRATRCALSYALVCLLNMPSHGQAVRSLMALDLETVESDWQMYKALTPMIDEMRRHQQPVDVEDEYECGIYSKDDDTMIVRALPLYRIGKRASWTPNTVDYGRVVKCFRDLSAPEESYAYLKLALSFTEFDYFGEPHFKVGNAQQLAAPGCQRCTRNYPRNVYSPACHHFVSCHFCRPDTCKAQTLADYKCDICEASVSGVTFEINMCPKSPKRSIARTLHSGADDNADAEIENVAIVARTLPGPARRHIENMLKSIEQCSGVVAFVQRKLLLQYFYRLAEDMGDSANCITIAAGDNYRWFTTSMRRSPSPYFKTLQQDAVAEERVPETQSAINYSILDFVSENPDHSIYQVINMARIGRVYAESDNECISCMEVDRELLIMSECGHRAMCSTCIEINGDRCPVCRSRGNNFLSIVPRRPKRKLDDAETTPCDNKCRSIA